TPEAEQIKREGKDLTARLLKDDKISEKDQQTLQQKLSIFDQLTVDVAIQNGEIEQALILAETSKNTCLRWLLNIDIIPDITYSQIQSKLNTNTVAIYWHLSPISLTTFIILANSKLEYITLNYNIENERINLQQWEDWLTQWNEDYMQCRQTKTETKTSSWFEKIETRLQQLSKILQIDTLKTYLNSEINTLLLIPHRDLHRLPLQYFFDDYICNYIPSFAMITSEVEDNSSSSLEESSDNLLLVENPKHKGYKGSLYSTGIEAALIKKQFSKQFSPVNHLKDDPDDKTKRITAEKLIQELKKPYNIFHFNGHGNYNQGTPRHSCLFLSDDETLTTETIVKKLDLQTYKLVTLAACETAVTGNETITSEYVGLVSGFLHVGVKNILSTLWTVESFTTTLFMVEFYTNLQKYPPNISLKETQNWLKTLTKPALLDWLTDNKEKVDSYSRILLEQEIKRITKEIKEEYPYHNPYYWSAFIISGRE
ncbi:MAG: CHAT domain-containing protein, partial [Crocosphaera sp.]